MAKILNENMLESVKQLIKHLSNEEESTEDFTKYFKEFYTVLKRSDSMYFLNKKDVDQNIAGMQEKFSFHGFFRQADSLKCAFSNYIPDSLHKSEMVNRLNVVKFLLCMSEKPTEKFLRNPESYAVNVDIAQPEEKINWAEYLVEGIEKWAPNFDEKSDISDYSETELTNVESTIESSSKMETNFSTGPRQIDSGNKDIIMDLRTNREELLNTIQTSWYNEDKFYMKPESDWKEARIGVDWEKYLTEEVSGLRSMQTSSVISEYLVLREIIWQLFQPHNSTVVGFSGNNIVPKSDITISSVRSVTFKLFMDEFIPYIELLDYFRQFHESLIITMDNKVPSTYKSYIQGVNEIIAPVYEKVCDLEETIRQQETTYTLLMLAEDLKEIFRPVNILKRIHEEVICKEETDPMISSITLLAKLHISLEYVADKTEQDIRVTLFLHSLFHYLHLIDRWLNCDDFTTNGEFIIDLKNPDKVYEKSFEPNPEAEKICQNDSFLKIIYEKVLNIGKNISLLRWLGKYDVLNDNKERFYHEFIRKVLSRLCNFYNVNESNYLETHDSDHIKEENVSSDEDEFSLDYSGWIAKMAESEKLLNRSLIEEKGERETTLYKKIGDITKNLFPKSDFFENILHSILDERFKISGLILKELLVEKYSLLKHFAMLRHLYLFEDDLIFPFFQRFFEDRTSKSDWGNEIWLTSHLQDVLNDSYPEICSEHCFISVMDEWIYCKDAYTACTLMDVLYKCKWPLSIFITQEHITKYRTIFKFLLSLKWALHTVNHLVFTALEPKRKKFVNSKYKKLYFLKFVVVNLLSCLQQFIYGYTFRKCVLKFELDFEKAHDLTSLIESHHDFIEFFYEAVSGVIGTIQKSNTDNEVINCVRALKMMWLNPERATHERIKYCFDIYGELFTELKPHLPNLFLKNMEKC